MEEEGTDPRELAAIMVTYAGDGQILPEVRKALAAVVRGSGSFEALVEQVANVVQSDDGWVTLSVLVDVWAKADDSSNMGSYVREASRTLAQARDIAWERTK